MLASFRNDLRYAVRALRRTPGFTAAAVATLALGIGANTALFTGVNGLLLRTVPVPNPDTLVRLGWAGKNQMQRSSSNYGFTAKNAAGEEAYETISYPAYQALVAANQTLTGIAAGAPANESSVVYQGRAELASTYLASGNYFEVLGVPAQLGRTLSPADDSDGAPPVAVISDAYWRKRFGADPSVPGKTVTVGASTVVIVGVTPPEFTGIQDLTAPAPDLTLTLAMDRQLGGTRLNDGWNWWVQTFGRLKPGVTPEQVRANLDGTFQAAALEGWTSYFAALSAEDKGLANNQNRTAVPHFDVTSAARGIYQVDQNQKRSVTILSVVVGLLLVIVCANVANLLLSRAAVRQKEVAVRLAMGASRWRLVRSFLTESVLLALLGGALGLLIGYWSRALLPFGKDAPLDWRVFTFATALCLATGIAFGLLPALRATRMDVSASMKETSRSVVRSRSLSGKVLLATQVALSVVVLIGAGLFLQTLKNLRSVEVGFDTRNLVVFNVQPRLNGYDAARAGALLDRMHEELERVPGVRSVSHSQLALLEGYISRGRLFAQDSAVGEQGMSALTLQVSPEFLETMQVPLLRGRDIDARDTLPNAPPVAVINEAMARTLFPDGDALGKRFGNQLERNATGEIVGIIGDTKYNTVRDAAPPTLYRPFPHESTGRASFQVRVAGDPAPMQAAIREAVRRADPNLPIAQMTTQTELVEARFSQERLFAMTYVLFGSLGLVLVSIGLFGLMSYNVACRTNEIGIRMALGAQAGRVLKMVIGESLVVVAIGVVCGIGVALAAGRWVASLMFGVAPSDPVTIVGAVVVMVAVGLVAAYLPARRASRVEPLVALHHD